MGVWGEKPLPHPHTPTHPYLNYATGFGIIKRPLLFVVAGMALWALIWLNTSRRAETNSFSSDTTVEGGGPGSAYPPDWDSHAEPLSAAQMGSVLEVVGTTLCERVFCGGSG